MVEGVVPSAGRLLREAREKQGLHIAALAASIKVPPKKLEALEQDRFAELPDLTFVRALAQTVCRALKIDPVPVLALLPPLGSHRLERVSEGLNTTFRERPASLLPGDWTEGLANPVLWLIALLLVAALLVYLLPSGVARWLSTWASVAPPVVATETRSEGSAPGGAIAPATPSEAAAGANAAPGTPPAAVAGALPALPPAATANEPPSLASAGGDAPVGMLQLRAADRSWVEVVDGRGVSLLSRMLLPGETIGVEGAPPLRLRIGNAAATQVVFRGQPTELQPYTRDNVARLELK